VVPTRGGSFCLAKCAVARLASCKSGEPFAVKA
jgi:hypothetical protein